MKAVEQKANQAAQQGPRQRMTGQRGSLRTPGPGQFIHDSPSAKGPKEGLPRTPKTLARSSFATEGKEGTDRG